MLIIGLVALFVVLAAVFIISAVSADDGTPIIIVSEEAGVLISPDPMYTSYEVDVEDAYLAEDRPDPREFYDELADVDYDDPPDADPIDSMLDFD